MAKRKGFMPEAQPSPAAVSGRLGGLARARNKENLKKIKEWSSKGGTTTFERYGSQFQSYITTKRKFVGRWRKPVANSQITTV